MRFHGQYDGAQYPDEHYPDTADREPEITLSSDDIVRRKRRALGPGVIAVIGQTDRGSSHDPGIDQLEGIWQAPIAQPHLQDAPPTQE